MVNSELKTNVGVPGRDPEGRYAHEHTLRPSLSMPALALAMTLLFVAPLKAQKQMPDQAQSAEGSAGKTSRNYNVQQSIEFGYRDSMIGGNLDNYDTFENLHSGFRLFDYNVDIRSVD